MEIEDLLSADNVVADFKASSKKQTIQALSRKLAAHLGLDPRLVFDKLLDRERLGSTGVGKGVAIPHARIEGITEITGLFARLAAPIDFDSVDDQPVDLVFMLLAPEDAGADHLKALAKVSRLLRDDRTCDKLRQTSDASALFAMLAQPASNAA
ncbi:PTS IIA-like nitrogen regulatory protein PtsN [Kordiimonas marina]|uniref:PTS IIA-like nitrogen regulatory protein PtsN n=1 Tax=Kordiimonas marina TaxID=2872312 RepID=UPI001FF1BFEB|nr:PTS IIA-like nitrogen regulatory protein PtsN [Kordiimonas marina]MCJ9428120.1 PTS IIA-like nitrogen regulatory protein PtsN [Kordiimonas marina]